MLNNFSDLLTLLILLENCKAIKNNTSILSILSFFCDVKIFDNIEILW